jgi:hypothetical protein
MDIDDNLLYFSQYGYVTNPLQNYMTIYAPKNIEKITSIGAKKEIAAAKSNSMNSLVPEQYKNAQVTENPVESVAPVGSEGAGRYKTKTAARKKITAATKKKKFYYL